MGSIGVQPEPNAHGAAAPRDDELIASIERDTREVLDGIAARLPRSRSLAQLLLDPEATKPPPVVVPGLAWKGRLTLVAAREGTGKSTLLSAVAAAVTTGGEFLGERCAKGMVLWALVE